jgi:hypothetical protein
MNLPLPIPIQVLYAGLAGTGLALIVATITNRWSLKVFFLLALRLAIGWHFLFEGLHKVHSHYVGASETSRPFSSEPYFTAGEGPLARVMRERIGDPDKDLQAKLTPQNADKLTALSPGARVDRHAGAGEWRRPNGEPYEPFPDFLKNREKGLSEAERQELNDPEKGKEYLRKAAKEYAERQVADLEAFAKMAPADVRKDWDGFVATLTEKYKLTPEEQKRLDGTLDDKEREQLVARFQAAETADPKERKALQDKSGHGDVTLNAMAAYGRWAAGVEGRPSKLKYISSGDAALTAPERLEYIEHRKAEVAELEKRVNDKLGVGYGHEQNRMKDAKATITLARSALLTDADDFLTELKKGAVAETVGKRFAKKAPGPAIVFGGLDADPDAAPPTPDQAKKANEQRAAKLDALAALPAPPEPAFANLPPEIKAIWDRYLVEFKATYPMDEKSTKTADEDYGLLTTRLANWYYDHDEFSGRPGRRGFTTLLKKYTEVKAASGPESADVGVFDRMVRSVWEGALYAAL